MPLILASASPRRRELLTYLGVPFEVVVSDFDESTLAHLVDPVEYVAHAAEAKALAVASRCRDAIILGLDTDVVAPDGTILGKPGGTEDARRMLRLLAGRTHRVYSATCALRVELGIIKMRACCTVATSVSFRSLDEATIDAYLRSNEFADKAGGYGIQGRAMGFVERVEGDLSAVVGLPLMATTELLRECGVSL